LAIQDFLPRWTGVAILVCGLLAVWRMRNLALARFGARRKLINGTAAAAALWMMLALASSVRGVDWRLPRSDVQVWFRAASMGMILLAVGACVARLPFEGAARLHPGRRRFLEKAADLAMVAPPVAFARGAWVAGRNDIRLVEVEIPVKGLAKDLDGLSLVQITDIHMSPFFSAAQLDRAIDIANEAKADIGLVTGDLISGVNDPLDLCLDRLKRLKASSGVFGCHGNHELYVRCQRYATERGREVGIRYLRRESEVLRFGSAALRITGIDYQAKDLPYLEEMAPPPRDALNLLLSHNPDVFPVAAGLGFDVTIAGHTHGGQVTTEILNQHLNPARYITRYVCGLYQEGGRSIYVSRGLGTVGVPVRLGAPPEVSLIRLRAA
jgi:predicted MPP superfamily phosphohydrolase